MARFPIFIAIRLSLQYKILKVTVFQSGKRIEDYLDKQFFFKIRKNNGMQIERSLVGKN